jgi:quercetin dioxygenase-like cupin family protein
VVKGTVLEHREGAPDRTYGPGEAINEQANVNHWVENKGSEPVTLINVDLIKE